MIVARIDSRLRFITQPDHARFAGELLSLWRADGLPAHPRRDDLLFAAREHDNGWREADAAPQVDAGRGRPHDFRSLPDAERVAIWERGAERHLGERPRAALLIVEHALALHRERGGDPLWAPLLERLAEARHRGLEACGLDERELAADYRWIELADLLSLAACGGWSRETTLHGYCAEARTGELGLDPFPLAGATTFRVPCRWLPLRRFSGDADLGSALAEARWGHAEVRVAPFGSSGSA